MKLLERLVACFIVLISIEAFAFLFFRLGAGDIPDIENIDVSSDEGKSPRLVVKDDGDCVVVYEVDPSDTDGETLINFRPAGGREQDTFTDRFTAVLPGAPTVDDDLINPAVSYSEGVFFYTFADTIARSYHPEQAVRYGVLGVLSWFRDGEPAEDPATAELAASRLTTSRSVSPTRPEVAAIAQSAYVGFESTNEAFATTPVMIDTTGATWNGITDDPFGTGVPLFPDYPEVRTGLTDDIELWQITAIGAQRVTVQSFILPGMVPSRGPDTYDFSTGLAYRTADGYVTFSLDPANTFLGGEVIYFRTYPGRGTKNMASQVMLSKVLPGTTQVARPIAGLRIDDDGDGFIDEDPHIDLEQGLAGLNEDPENDVPPLQSFDEDDVNHLEVDSKAFRRKGFAVEQHNVDIATEEEMGGDPTIAYIVWEDNRRKKGRHTWDIRFARYDDATQTVAARSWVNAKKAKRRTADAVEPSIAVVNAGRNGRPVIYVVWTSKRQRKVNYNKIRLSKSVDYGMTWSKPISLTGKGPYDQPDIAVAPLYPGHSLEDSAPLIYVVYRDRSLARGRIICIQLHDTDPSNPSASTVVERDARVVQVDSDYTATGVENPQVAVDRVGNAYVAWNNLDGIRFARSFDLIPGAPKVGGSVHLAGWSDLGDAIEIRLRWTFNRQEDFVGYLIYRATENDYQDALMDARQTGVPLDFSSIGTLLGPYDEDNPLPINTFTDVINKSDLELTVYRQFFRYAVQGIEDSGRPGRFTSLDGDDGRIMITVFPNGDVDVDED